MGTRTSNLDQVAAIEEVIGHADIDGEKKSVRIPIDSFAAQIEARRGPSYATLAELEADLSWLTGAEARVWGDAELANRGIYKKSGASGAGDWTRIGPLPETDISHSLRVPEGEFIDPFPDAETRAGTVPMFDENGQPTTGPTALDIANAQGYAVAAAQNKTDADAAREAAQQAAVAAALAAEEAANSAAGDATDISYSPLVDGNATSETVQGAIEQLDAGLNEKANIADLGSEVPIGTMVPWFGLEAPNDFWILVDTVGQVASRSLFPKLFDVLAPEFEVVFASGDPVVTGIGFSRHIAAGMAVEGGNIPAGTTILSVDGPSQITLSANPTDDGTALRIFPHGAGDGATTFGLPNVAGRVHRALDSTGAVNTDAGNYLGELQADAFQHFEGSFSLQNIAGFPSDAISNGVFEKDTGTSYTNRATSVSGASNPMKLDPSLTARTASETRVKAIIAPYIIKVADGVDDPAIIAAANVVADLAAAQAKIAALQNTLGSVAILEFQKPNGESGGAGTANAWTKYPLNTEKSDPKGILSADDGEFVPLIDGHAFAECDFYRTGDTTIRIYNVTDGETVADGISGYIRAAEGPSCLFTASGLLEAGKTYRVEYWISIAGSTFCLGQSASPGDSRPEVFGRLTFRGI